MAVSTWSPVSGNRGRRWFVDYQLELLAAATGLVAETNTHFLTIFRTIAMVTSTSDTSTKSEPQTLRIYSAWDLTSRWFHWINALCVMGLIVFGLAILNAKVFGVSADGKILLKTLHVYVGYVFAINLVWRLIWAFIGSASARWRAILPFRHGFLKSLRLYMSGIKANNTPLYLGHNPLGRLMVSLLFLLLVIQAATGLVLAGTDLYKPPFGGIIAEWVTNGDQDKLANLMPGSKENVDLVAYEQMREFRSPVIATHLYTFYILLGAVLLHIAGVVLADVREKSGLISAMFTGQKVLSESPVDVHETQ